MKLPFILFSLFLSSSLFSQDSDPSLMRSASFFIPSEKTIRYRIGETDIPIHVTNYGDRTDMVFINLHDNEKTSVNAAKSIVQSTGGIMIRIENKDQRVIRFKLKGQVYAFDPNRIFSEAGIVASMKELGRISPAAIDEVKYFAERMLSLIPADVACIVALHNNTNNAYSVMSYLPGHERATDAIDVHQAIDQDPDDIAFTTDSFLFLAMKNAGFNSILQDNAKVKQDGSLSVWAGNNNRRYINIETEHGKFTQYVNMLGKLLEIIENE